MRQNWNDQGDLLKGTYVGETLNNRPHGFGIFTHKQQDPHFISEADFKR